MIENTSVIIPALNEEKFLEGTIEDTLGYLAESSELIVVTDPSKDRTEQIAQETADEYSNVVHLEKEHRHGKGRAIEEGIKTSKKEKIAFMDADKATTPDQLENIIMPLDEGYEMVIGSRYLPDSDTKRKRLREIPSRLFNKFTANALGTEIKDHQCGFKAFQADKIKDMVSLEDGGFPWDLELLYKARKNGLEIKEVPVRWRAKEGSAITKLTYIKFLKKIYHLSMDRFFGEKADNIHKYGKFASIGALGAIVNTVLLYALTDVAGLHYMVSGALSIEAAIVTMFFLNNRFTFSPVKRGLRQIIDGLIVSNLVRSVGVAAQLALLYVLTDVFNMYYLLSNIFAIFVSSILTFVGENRFNWTGE